jgi:hypothetical protein
MPINSPSTLDNNLSTGGTNAQGLSDWSSDYVTDYLGKAKALSGTGYETYKGPLTAGPSQIQDKVFQGINSLNFPGNLGKSFSSTGAYQPPTYSADGTATDVYQFPTYNADGTATGGAAGTPGLASQYMNPYLQSVLTPQLDELRRQSQITQMGNNAKFANAGAFGGGRQAIVDAENQRNLMQEQNKTVGTGYANAYDKAMGQFNTEQGQAKTLADLMSTAGATQRGIESEGVAADLAEFEKQRQFPYQQLTFARDMLTGLPTSSVSNTPGEMSDVGNILATLGGGTKVAEAFGYKNVGDLLKTIGLDFGP